MSESPSFLELLDWLLSLTYNHLTSLVPDMREREPTLDDWLLSIRPDLQGKTKPDEEFEGVFEEGLEDLAKDPLPSSVTIEEIQQVITDHLPQLTISGWFLAQGILNAMGQRGKIRRRQKLRDEFRALLPQQDS